MRKNKRGHLQISFGWLFAIIIGITIIALAIYFVVKMSGTESTLESAETSKEIGILLNPLETSFESAVSSSFTFPEKTRIYNRCDTSGYFGAQKIESAQKIFNKWTKTDLEVSFRNKYIFSEKVIEGKTFYIFSKPFEFPFKVADLIYLTPDSKNYCFIDAPIKIRNEISDLSQANLRFGEDCTEEDIKVCFEWYRDCDIFVDYDIGRVEKNNEILYFEGDALMYAGIFSDKETYELQLKRLMQRIEILATIYINKANYLISKGCEPVMNSDLSSLINTASAFENSAMMHYLASLAENLENKNRGECKLW